MTFEEIFGDPPKKKTLIEKLNKQIEITKSNIDMLKGNIKFHKDNDEFDKAHLSCITLKYQEMFLDRLEFILND